MQSEKKSLDAFLKRLTEPKHLEWLEKRLPKGRFNGKLVQGFNLTFSTHLTYFHWLPRYGGKYNRIVFWLFFSVRWEYVKHDHPPTPTRTYKTMGKVTSI